MFSACGKHHPQNRDELVELLRDESIKLDSIDTSKITDMSLLFADFPRDKCDKLSSDKYLAPYIQNCKNNAGKREDFSGIETWDVSNVKDMNSMFSHAKSFNQPLNKWNVSKVESMDSMFFGALSFNQPLDKWDVSEVVIMWSVFENAKSFNQNLDSWDVSGLVSEAYMSKMFDNSPLESNPPKWYKK
ncbi:hypothetical protein CQA49_08265 [Helicobacter sp. MIT 00-7814]|nr:hypothetical protein CQA37_08880 [Helicobacter sp. MIT 99-10781]RDU52551.1 hypothetical protein CQA49_08265 [Helicobacter sp. MIT 00-7814]